MRKRKPYKTLNILVFTFTKHLTTWQKHSIENDKYIKFSVKVNVSHGYIDIGIVYSYIT